MSIAADFVQPLRALPAHPLHPGLARFVYLLRVRSRLARRRRLRHILRAADRAGAHRWMLALPQSRHGG